MCEECDVMKVEHIMVVLQLLDWMDWLHCPFKLSIFKWIIYKMSENSEKTKGHKIEPKMTSSDQVLDCNHIHLMWYREKQQGLDQQMFDIVAW